MASKANSTAESASTPEKRCKIIEAPVFDGGTLHMTSAVGRTIPYIAKEGTKVRVSKAAFSRILSKADRKEFKKIATALPETFLIPIEKVLFFYKITTPVIARNGVDVLYKSTAGRKVLCTDIDKNGVFRTTRENFRNALSEKERIAFNKTHSGKLHVVIELHPA